MLVLILSAATYGVHNAPARYVALEGGFAEGMAPPEDLRQWRQSSTGLTFAGEGPRTEVRLAARRARAVAALQAVMTVPDGADGLRVELNFGAEGLEPGAEPWQNARLQVLSFDRAGNFLWYWPRDILMVSADRPPGPASAVLPVYSGFKFVLVRVYNGADSGVLRIGPPRIVPLAERPVFAFLRGALVLAWLVTGLWAARAAARRTSTPLRAAILLGAAAFTLAGTLTPQPGFRTVTEPIESLALAATDLLFARQASPPPQARQVPGIPGAADKGSEAGSPARGAVEEPAESPASEPAAPNPARIRAAPSPDYPFSTKHAAHFGVFFLLGLACYAAFPRSSWLGRTLCLASFAVATESLQWFVVTRGSSILDLAVDLAGLALAAAMTAAFSWIMAAVKARNRDRALPGARS